jgi:hypothetical protein
MIVGKYGFAILQNELILYFSAVFFGSASFGNGWVSYSYTIAPYLTKRPNKMCVIWCVIFFVPSSKAHRHVFRRTVQIPPSSTIFEFSNLNHGNARCFLNIKVYPHLLISNSKTWLKNDGPIESVNKMAGHKSLQTTQQYAKILDKKNRNDMDSLRNIYKAKLKYVSGKIPGS